MVSGFAQAELVAVPNLSARVTDLTQTLSQAEQAQLEQKLAAFEQQKGSQIAVLIVLVRLAIRFGLNRSRARLN